MREKMGTSKDHVTRGWCNINNPRKPAKLIEQMLFLFSPLSSFPYSLTFLPSSSFFLLWKEVFASVSTATYLFWMPWVIFVS